MPQYQQAAFNTFVGGLLTEAGELTFPENASVDENNCDLLKDGSRRRRLGIEQESGGSWTTATDVSPVTTTTVVSTSTWHNVGDMSDTTFTVVQIGSELIFYQQGSDALSDSRVNENFSSSTPYIFDLSTHNADNNISVESVEISTTVIKGALIVSSPAVNTFYIQRDTSTGSFSSAQINFKIRDYEYQGDRSSYYTATKSPSNARKYDTFNSGWPQNELDSAKADGGGRWPRLTHPWYSGKDENGDFQLSEWYKVAALTSIITNGTFIVDLYSVSRRFLSTQTERARFSTVAAYAGRVFYSGMQDSTNDNGSKIFFSEVVEEGFKSLGRCYQRNDPTSEILSDLLDTDGGYISIPDAFNIQKIHVFGSSLWVFAQNGVWRVSGVDDVFRPSEYSVTKVSSDGITTSGSFVSAETRPYWWTSSGIFSLQADELGNISPKNLSVNTIQSFWDAITPAARDKVKGIYDESTRRVMWLYPDAGESTEAKLNNVIMFDEVLQSFIPWSFVDQDTNTNYIAGMTFQQGIGGTEVTSNIVDSSLDTVVDSSSDTVVSVSTGRSLTSSRVKFLVVNGATGYVSWADITNTSFLDWGDTDYTSYAETGFNFMGDLETRKTVPYITVFLKDTATGWTAGGENEYNLVRDSGLKLMSFWDFKDNASTTGQQCFRRKRRITVDTGDLSNYDYDRDVIITRLKIRGRGRVVNLKWESETGKDFHLLGWNAIGATTGKF